MSDAMMEQIHRYETGGMTDHDELVQFYQELINSGLAWKLQSRYGRNAVALIQTGVCQLADRSQCGGCNENFLQ